MNASGATAVGVIIVMLMLIFIGIWIWAWLPHHKKTFDATGAAADGMTALPINLRTTA